MDALLWRSFPGLAAAKLAFCWPIRKEYDARPLAQRLRERGTVTALPVVVGPRQPLIFHEWHPGVEDRPALTERCAPSPPRHD